MKKLDGYNYTVYYKGVKLDGVSSIIVDGNNVRVQSEYAHTGMGSGDCIGFKTNTYNLEDVKIVRRGGHELHSKEDKE